MKDFEENSSNEIRTKWVVIITSCTMMLEIYFGISTKSMALLSDGIHMASHALAIGISFFAYFAVRKLKNKNFKGDKGKILYLSVYSNGLLLLLFAGIILVEAVKRFFNPLQIFYKEAILIAAIGLIINLICAGLLFRKKEKTDFNIRSAYLHVLADTITSISAISGLFLAMKFNIQWMDTLGAIVCFLAILKWSAELLKNSGKHLLNIPQ